VLSILVFEGPSTVGELAALEQVKPPTMSRLVSGLEHDGLARRRGDVRDGRLVLVFPTGKGRKILEKAREKRLSTLARRLGNLSPEELTLVQEAVGSLRRILE
jgi:DNA-binding MarR family transcriptional regulator